MELAQLLTRLCGSHVASSLLQERELRTDGFRVFSGDVAKLHIGKRQRGRTLFVCVWNQPAGSCDWDVFLSETYGLLNAVSRRAAGAYVVLVCLDEAYPVRDEFTFAGERIFVVDNEICDASETHSGSTPLQMAIREKLSTQEIAGEVLSPYVGSEPAVGSSFFGREAELRSLVSTSRSYAVVGARMIGKTSLLHEAACALREEGHDVVFVDAQAANTMADVENLLLGLLDPRRLERAIRTSAALQETPLRAAVKLRTKKARGQVVLVIDELGNVLTWLSAKDWQRFGVLRSLVQTGQVRLLFSSFQEFSAKQREAFDGPFVNLASQMRLGMLDREDVELFIGAPLALIGQHASAASVAELAWSETGGHPLLLQLLGCHLFEALHRHPSHDPLSLTKAALFEELEEVFAEPLQLLFEFASPLEQLLFLYLGEHSGEDAAGIDLAGAYAALEHMGVECTLDLARNLLLTLEMRGLIVRRGPHATRFSSVNPLFYRYAGSRATVEWLMERLRAEGQVLGTRRRPHDRSPRARPGVGEERSG